jgi:hypothetical protein
MDKNVGGYDRLARFVVGPVLLVVGLAAVTGVVTLASGLVGLALAIAAILVGAVFLVTAATRKCPLNRTLGLNTYRGGESSAADDDDATAGGAA